MSEEFIFCYINCSSREEALTIGRQVVQKRLAACANILDGMTSVYHWQGEVVEDTETVLVTKTKSSLFCKLKEAICEIHSYDVPCVIAMPIADGHEPYLQWISQETTDEL